MRIAEPEGRLERSARRRAGWTIPIAACILALAGRDVAAQQPAAPNGTRSTLAGVYTREQAVRGQDVYAGTCKSCHAPASHTGSVFATSWGGKLLSELFLYVSERMPKNDPGSLSWEEYADVTAYLLRLNGQPIGREELPPDSLALRRIRIEVPAGPQRELRER